MITIQLLGGLGNQMFQYAAAKSLAEKNKTKVRLDLTWFDQQFDSGTTPRTYELDCFVLDKKIIRYEPSHLDFFKNMLVYSYKEPHFQYDPKFYNLPKQTTLKGYFQSEKYFSDIRAILLEDFFWAKKPSGKNSLVLKEIQNTPNCVSVHVRRGDYVSNENAAKFHGLTGVEYYQAAVKTIAKSVNKIKLYIFSDEPEWCKKNLKFQHDTVYVSHNSEGSEDMRLMKACRHNIIANSSFSWWGAWLNENPEKIVIAPKTWFSHGETNTNDVIPESWLKI